MFVTFFTTFLCSKFIKPKIKLYILRFVQLPNCEIQVFYINQLFTLSGRTTFSFEDLLCFCKNDQANEVLAVAIFSYAKACKTKLVVVALLLPHLKIVFYIMI